jgi:hypothetical protein
VYTVTVTCLPNATAAITSVDVANNTGIVWSGLNITVNLPSGTNINSIAPVFTLSTNASIWPSGPQNFATPSNNTITYTVTAADGITKTNYNIKMNVAASSAMRITGFTVSGVSAEVAALINPTINEALKTINVSLPSGLPTTFIPNISYEGTAVAAVPPSPGALDFSTQKTYRVTAANSSTQDYTVSAATRAAVPESLINVTVNGTPGGLVTTQLTLDFSADITTLTAANITLSGGNYTKGALVKGTGNSWALAITGTWSQGNTVGIAVADPIGYGISGSPATAVLNAYEPDLMVKFGIKQAGYSSYNKTNVEETFTAVAAYLKSDPPPIQTGSGTMMRLGSIKIGDYVQLKSLSVAGDGQAGAINAADLKVKVVGINPYKNLNGNGTDPHLVFQFEKTVTNRRMHLNDYVNYKDTEMRRYLTPVDGVSGSGKFYTGLTNAGVPSNLFWDPVRIIGKKQNTSSPDSIADKVFLPTVWEVSEGVQGYNNNGSGPITLTNGEVSGTQGRLSAYFAGTADSSKVKYDLANQTTSWWLASPCYSSTSTAFCGIGFSGLIVKSDYASDEVGIAPAFCIK